jgi:hypothetical protein
VQITVDVGLVLAALAALLIFWRYSKRREDALVARVEKLQAEHTSLKDAIEQRREQGRQRVSTKPTIHRLSIRLSAAGGYQLRTAQNELPGPMSVRPGDIIVWDPGEAEAVFQFPRIPFFTELRDFTVRRDAGTPLEVTVSPQVPKGAYVYAVYCKKGALEGYTEGGGPPTLIVVEG